LAESSESSELLESSGSSSYYSHTPRKRFGQNFLKSDSVLAQMVQAISPRKLDLLVEIGPGQGALTGALLPHVDCLEVVELDRDLIPVLENKFLDHKVNNKNKLNIHESDVLKFDFKKLIKNQDQQLRVVGNLPYNISTDLLFYLLDFLPNILDMHFLLQKEVIDRLAAPKGSSEYGRLSILIQYFCEVQPLFLVPPDSFYPVPKVMSQFVRLIPREPGFFKNINYKNLDFLLRTAFQMRRKTLRNNFKNKINNFTDDFLRSRNISPDARPQDLSIEEYVDLAGFV